MSSVDAWLALADTMAICPDPAARERLSDALARLIGLGTDQAALATELEGRGDAAATLLQAALATRVATEPTASFCFAAAPVFTDADAGRARSVAASVTAGADVSPGDLVALSPDAAAGVVQGLVSSGRYDVLAHVAVQVPPQRFPVPLLLRTAASIARGLPARDALVQAAARVSELHLLRGLADVVGSADVSPDAVAAVVDEVVTVRAELAFAPYQWWPNADGQRPAPPAWEEPTRTVPRPRSAPAAPKASTAPPAPEAPPVPAAPPVPDQPAGVAPPAAGSQAARHRSPAAWRAPRWPFGRGQRAEASGAPAPLPPPAPAERPRVFRSAEASDAADREAYPRLDVASGTDRADVVVVDVPFQVTVGLQGRRDRGLVSGSPVTFVAGETVAIELVLLFDPTSISVTGEARARLTVSDAEPHPSLSFTCTALYGDDLAAQRRLGMQLLRDGQVVAVAWRTIVAVDSLEAVESAVVPARREVELLDLDPLVGDEPPDLVVSVCRADAGSTTFVWTAYAADPTVSVPDLPSACTLDTDLAAFATETRRAVQFSGDLAKDYLDIAGRARRIGRAMPEGIQDAIRSVVEAPGRGTAPSILLLTEELSVPWELAAFDPPLTDGWGGGSPFLGAHTAVSRWPLTEHKPRPRPRPQVSVRRAAVLTADYEGVAGWGRLESALAEGDEIAALFEPPAARVAPELWTVTDLFRGTPESDIVHVALHGQYDAQGDQEGLVLLTKSPAGGATAQFLSPVDLENGQLDQGPFVFLNACQVGTDERVLGDYGGFASTLLRIGATAVVAPLWNVRDDVAAAFARQFYASTLTAPEPVSAAEAVRALRATYTEAGVRAGEPGLHATLVAYQVFGHPRLRLARSPAG